MQYILTIQVNFDALDDCEARREANIRLAEMDEDNFLEKWRAKIKLQRIKTDQKPEKVEL